MALCNHQKLKSLLDLVEGSGNEDPGLVGLYLAVWIISETPEETAGKLRFLEEQGYSYRWHGPIQSPDKERVIEIIIGKHVFKIPIFITPAYYEHVLAALEEANEH